MADAGSTEVDMIFLGLTRPPMLFGVSYMFAVVNFMACILGFLVFGSGLKTFLMLPFFHAIGYYFSSKEPLFIELFIIRGKTCTNCKNRAYHGFTNSYDVS